MKKITKFPLWLSILWGGFLLFGIPFLLGWLVKKNFLFHQWYLPMAMICQALFAYGVIVFLSKDNVTRKAFFHVPSKPFLMAGAIMLGWVSVLLTVTGILFIGAILINIITNGEVARLFSSDMASYQGAYRELFSALESKGVFLKLLMVFLVAGIVPLTEEWLFRGLLFEGISRHLGKRWGLVMQALLFALLHPLGFYSLLYVAIGLMLGWFRFRFDSLWPGIWAHQFQNFVAVFGFLVGGQTTYALDPRLFDPFQLWLMIPFTFLSLFGVIITFRSLLHWEIRWGNHDITTSTEH